MAFNRTLPFSGSGGRLDYDKLDQAVQNTKELIEGTAPFERLALYRRRITDTGTQSDYDIDSGMAGSAVGFSYVQWNGSSDVTFTGFQDGVDGRTVFFENITSAKAMLFAHDVTSTAANRIYNPGNVSKQAFGPGGRGMVIYDGTSSRWRLVVIDPGGWIEDTFDAADFTGSGSMTWTLASGDQVVRRYRQHGTRLDIAIDLATTTVGGTPSTTLQMQLPNGLTCAYTVFGQAFRALDNGGAATAVWRSTATSANIGFELITGANWTASTNLTYIQTVIAGLPVV